MLIVFEGLILSFWLLLICVVGIAKDGPVGLVVFYEQEVQDRVIELGLTTKERIKKISIISTMALFLPMVTVFPAIVYFYNGVNGFRDCFIQLTVIYLIAGLFDRLFIDWWWVGHTKAWIIPGTEEFMPYIYGKTLVGKWVGTLIGFPILAAIISGVITLLT
ncbi:MAG: hypothetical protein IKP88_04270 [Lachnospiraceae bacterium]|nr:hypothetical protein [Lachnospiraceae bacterium]